MSAPPIGVAIWPGKTVWPLPADEGLNFAVVYDGYYPENALRITELETERAITLGANGQRALLAILAERLGIGLATIAELPEEDADGNDRA